MSGAKPVTRQSPHLVQSKSAARARTLQDGDQMRTSAAAPRYEVAISSAEYDVAVAREITEQLRARLLGLRGDAVWNAEVPAAPVATESAGPVWTDARVVVILQERLWGRTGATRGHAEAIAARHEREGSGFLRVVQLDGTKPPAWGNGVQVRQMSDGIEAIVDWLVDAVRAAGGVIRGGATRSKADSENIDPKVAVREHFLGTSRALQICTREFERLTNGISKRTATIDAEATGAKPEVRRTPGRCIVQLGPVALTVSWVRDRVDTVAAGRLLIVEWRGTVHRAAPRIIEDAASPVAGPVVTLVREEILMAEATGEPDWLWRREGAHHMAYTSRDLAALCVDSLVAALQEERA